MIDRSEVEDALLGTMLMSRAAIATAVAEKLEAEDFSTHGRGVLFLALRRLYTLGDPVGVEATVHALRTMTSDGPDLLSAAGGRSGLLALQDHAPATDQADRLVRQVRELAAS